MTTHLPGRRMSRAFFGDAVERVAPRLLGKLLVRRTRGGVLAGRIVEVEAYLGPHHETPDRAAHSHRGPTQRNEVMFGPPGHAYVYSIYGRYFCMNITCERTGRAGCVLIRALEPVTGLAAMAKNRELALNFLERPDPGLPHLRKEHRKDARGLPSLRQDRRKDGATGEKKRDLDLRHLAQMRFKEMAALTSGPSRLCQALDITRPAHNGLDLLDARSVLQVRDDGFRPTRAQVTVRIGITHAAELPLRFCLEGHGCVSGPKRMPGSLVDID